MKKDGTFDVYNSVIIILRSKGRVKIMEKPNGCYQKRLYRMFLENIKSRVDVMDTKIHTRLNFTQKLKCN